MKIKDAINIPWIKGIEGEEKARILLSLGPGFGHGVVDKYIAKWKDHERQLYLFDVGLIGRSFEGSAVHSLYVIYYAGHSFALFEVVSTDHLIVQKRTTVHASNIFPIAIGALVFSLIENMQNGCCVERLDSELCLIDGEQSTLVPGQMGSRDV